MLFPAWRFYGLSGPELFFFVKIVEMLGCLGELMYICNSLDSV